MHNAYRVTQFQVLPVSCVLVALALFLCKLFKKGPVSTIYQFESFKRAHSVTESPL